MEDIEIKDCDFNYMFPSSKHIYIVMESGYHDDTIISAFESLERAKKEAARLNDDEHSIYIVKTNVL